MKIALKLSPLKCIGVGRFRILGGGGGGGGGGQGLEYCVVGGGGRGGARGGQIPSRHMTSLCHMMRNNIELMSMGRCIDVMCPLGFYKSVPNN